MPLSRASLLPITRSVSPSFSFTERSPRERIMTYPLARSSRQKSRRWPLVLRFGKGSIHHAVVMPLLLHTMFTCAVVWMHKRHKAVEVPNSIMPSVSIVVALMLVFRNQTAYSRFWNGRLHLNTITSAIRCLTRSILVLSPPPAAGRRGSDMERIDPHLLQVPSPGLRRAATRSMPDMVKNWEDEVMEEKVEAERRTVEAVKILVAMMYTCMNHLRADWGVALTPGTCVTSEGQETADIDYKDLLPEGLKGFEHRGLALTLELAVFVESFFSHGTEKGWFNTGHLAQMTNELNSLTKAYGNMEVIRLTPIPVAHLIHHQQTLAIYCVFLAFAMASEMGWWAVPIVAFVSFTLYGIEGIAQAFEDPFGKTKIDLKMDDIFEDTRREVEVMLEVWQTQNHNRSSVGADKCRMFVPHHKRRNSVGMAQPAAHAVVSMKYGRHIRWDSSVEITDTEQESSGATSPRTKEQMEGFGARRVTWGSAVGEADRGVFSTPVFFKGVGV